MDPQGNTTSGFGIDKNFSENGLNVEYSLLVGKETMEKHTGDLKELSINSVRKTKELKFLK